MSIYMFKYIDKSQMWLLMHPVVSDSIPTKCLLCRSRTKSVLSDTKFVAQIKPWCRHQFTDQATVAPIRKSSPGAGTNSQIKLCRHQFTAWSHWFQLTAAELPPMLHRRCNLRLENGEWEKCIIKFKPCGTHYYTVTILRKKEVFTLCR